MDKVVKETNLPTLKRKLEDVLGDDFQKYSLFLHRWFKGLITKEVFDSECRKLFSSTTVQHHNLFLLALLTRIQTPPDPATSPSIQPSKLRDVASPKPSAAQQPPASIRESLKRTKSVSSPVSNKRKPQSFVPADVLAYVPEMVAKMTSQAPGLSFCTRELCLPHPSMIHGRALVGAWDSGLEDVSDQVVKMMVQATQTCLKNVLSVVLADRAGFRVKNRYFRHALGENQPNPYLLNTERVVRHIHGPDHSSPMSMLTSADEPMSHAPSIRPGYSSALSDAAYLSACAEQTDEQTDKQTPVSLHDCIHSLLMYKQSLPCHSVYTLNLERMISRFWHPSSIQPT